MKLSEELIEIVEHEARGAIDTLRYASAFGHIERVLTDVSSCIVTLESENTRLAARVAELEEKRRCIMCAYCGEAFYEYPSDTPSEAAHREALEAFAAHDAACERNPLAKRVAELEEQRGAAAEECHKLCNEIADLQSQLAWTPVSAGLPTEEGAYEFEFRQTSKWRLQITKCGYCWSLLGKPMASHPEEFDEFRRIELPNGGES